MQNQISIFAIISLLCLSIFIGNSPAAAQSDPCEKEAQKYCPAQSGKDPRKYYCLNQVYTQLSNGCKAAVKKMNEVPPEDFQEECRADYNKFCAQEVPGGGRIVECLKEHSKEVSFECRKIITKAP